MKFYQYFFMRRVDYDWLLGILAAIPIAFPSPPLYWIALLCFLLVLPRLRFDRHGLYRLILIVSLWAIILVCSMIGDPDYPQYLPGMLGSLLVVSFFLFGYGLRNVDNFLDGFVQVITVFAVLTLIFFFLVQPYRAHESFFVSSELRMWAEDLLPEWPNVFCAFLCLGFFIRWLRGEYLLAALILAAAILTTSRIALVALGFVLVFGWPNYSRTIQAVILVSVVAGIAVIFSLPDLFGEFIDQRLLKYSDRLIILGDSLRAFSQAPFGIGSVRYDRLSEYYVSYHSSFLKILVRYGLVGFILFILLVKPRYFFSHLGERFNAPIFFLIAIGVFHDMLLHLHLAMMYSAFLVYRERTIIVESRVG